MSKTKVRLELLNREDSLISADYETAPDCCNDYQSETFDSKEARENSENTIINIKNTENNETELQNTEIMSEDITDGRGVRKRSHKCGEDNNNWAENKNVAEGLMDIALLSANANQLRFLITYNNKASTYYISLGLIALSLILQVAVGIVLIFKRRMKNSRIKRTRTRINEFLIGGVFMVTVVNVLLAAFTTTDGAN